MTRQGTLWFIIAVVVASAAVLALAQPWTADETTPSSASPEGEIETQIEATPSAAPDDVIDQATTVVPVDPPATDGPAPPADALLAEVTRLADGDSFDVAWIDEPPPSVRRDEVRLLGINAPEGFACFGPEARDVLDELIGDAPILVEVIESERDDFGRAIANAWNSDGVLLNLAMVDAGAALSLSDGGRHGDLIAAAQQQAKRAARGLWSTCGSQAELAILDLRPDARGRDDENPNDEWIDIVNLGATTAELTGWGIRDESTRHRFRFPDGFVLAPDEVIRVRSGCGQDTADDLYWCAEDPVWNNGGDTAFLVDADGRFVDEWGYSG